MQYGGPAVTAGREPAPGGVAWAPLLLALVHLGACLRFFPPSEIFSGEPLLTSDYVAHFLDGVRVAGFLHDGRFWDYSTTWAAGAPAGFVLLVNSKPFILLLACTPAALQPVAFNLAVLFCLWVFPTLLYLAARQFGLTRREAATTMLLAIVAWYGSSLLRVFWRGGSVLFPVGSALGLLLTGRLYRLWTEDPRLSGWVGVGLGAAALLWIHPVAAVVTIVGGLAVYLVTFRARGLRIVELTGISLIALVANLPWIWPFVRDAGIRRSLDYGILVGTPGLFLFDLVLGPLHLAPWHRGETAALGPLAVAAAVGLGGIRGASPLRRVLVAQIVAFALIAYAGGSLGWIASLQPYRFVIPLIAVLTIAGGPLVRMALPPSSSRVAAVAILLVAVASIDRVRVAGRGGDYLGAGLGRADRWALGVLREQAADESGRVRGRVLLDGDWLAEHVPGRRRTNRITYAFVGLERYLQAEWIGAPAMSVGVWQDYASVWKGELFGRSLADFDKAEFLRMSELYDLNWIASIRKDTREKLVQFGPEVTPIASSGPATIFRIDRTSNRVWSGGGVAVGEGSRIRFESAEASRAILKYHWMPGLVVTPPATIRPAKVDTASPCDFIEIDAPQAGVYWIGLPP